MANMREQYGADKAEKVFYASRNAGTITGVDKKAHPKMLAAALRRKK